MCKGAEVSFLGLCHHLTFPSQSHAHTSPFQDLLLPQFKAPAHFKDSPLMGALPKERDIFLYFR